MDLCKRTQQLWRIYMTAREPGALEEILEWVDPDCVVIGTGRHEFYDRLQPFGKLFGKARRPCAAVFLRAVNRSGIKRVNVQLHSVAVVQPLEEVEINHCLPGCRPLVGIVYPREILGVRRRALVCAGSRKCLCLHSRGCKRATQQANSNHFAHIVKHLVCESIAGTVRTGKPKPTVAGLDRQQEPLSSAGHPAIRHANRGKAQWPTSPSP